MPPFGSSPYAPTELYDYSAGPGSRISELILAAGEARARAQQRQGELLGSMVSNLGQQAGEAIQGERQRREQARVGEFVTAAQGEDFDIETELAKMPPEMRAGAMETYGKIENARSQRDQRKALAEKHKAEMEKLQREADEDDAYRLAAGAHGLLASLGTPGESAAREATFKYFAREHPEQVQQLASLPNEKLAPVLQQFVGSSQKYQKELADLEAKQAEPGFKREELTIRQQAEARQAAADASQERLGWAKLAEEKRGHDLSAGQGEGAPVLTDTAKDIAARRYLADGTLPPMGMGKAGARVRQDIINRAAEIDPQANIALNKATTGADTKSLAGLQKQRDAIGAFEQTAIKNVDIFLETAGKVVDTGSPIANQLLRHASGTMLGSPDVAAYEAARRVAVNEIAKITSNPTLAGQLSDSARAEVESFNPEGATLKQTVAVMRLLKRDMENRATSLDEQIVGVRRRLGEKPKAEGGGGGSPSNDPLGIR